jgi:DNA polymerase III epsilon subunit family exonuclease
MKDDGAALLILPAMLILGAVILFFKYIIWIIIAIFIIIVMIIVTHRKKMKAIEEQKRITEETKKEKQRLAREKFKREFEAQRAKILEQVHSDIVSRVMEVSDLDESQIRSMIKENGSLIDEDTLSTVPEYVAYDLETTGLNANSARIIEIGAVKIIDGLIIEAFQELINPESPIPESASKVNHITDDMVQGCRTISEVFPEFKKFIGKLPLVAHNAEFDYGFLKTANQRLYGKDFARRHYCTMKLYRKGLEYGQRSRLSDLIGNVVFDEKVIAEYETDAHRALTDAKVVYLAFEHLKKEYLAPKTKY